MSVNGESREPRRVAITGIGIVSPLGRTAAEHWERLTAGERAARRLPELTEAQTRSPAADGMTEDWRHWCGAPACGEETLPASGVLERMALAAAKDAISEGVGASLETVRPWRLGCVIGVSKPDLCASGDGLADNLLRLHEPSIAVAGRYGIQGPVLTPSAACATGLVSLIRGVELIRDGTCDVVVAGSTDWSLSAAYLAAYRRLGVLARGNGDPAGACLPFDRRRSGFVVGSGAALAVLEDWDRAVNRGARILAEWLGSALAGDASSLVDIEQDGETLARVIRDALRRSGRLAREIDIASLHGTGTRVNDLAETRALRKALGEAADRISYFSLKGSIGHLMGAAGSVETATLVLAMNHQTVPPTQNLQVPDPECDLDYTAGAARRRPIRCGLKVSLGFGGACAAAILGLPPAGQ